MGRSPKQLRDELRFLTDFGTLCDVMQQAAISQLGRADDGFAAAPRVADFLRRECLPMLPAAAAGHPLFKGARPLLGKTGAGPFRRTVVLLTSNDGLVGPLHSLAIRKALALPPAETSWILIGQRAVKLLGPAAHGARQMPLPTEEEAPQTWGRLAEILVEEHERGSSAEAVLIAPRYVSRSRQEIAVSQLLPLPAEAIGSAPRQHDILMEPSLEAVIRHMALAWVTAIGVEAQASSRRAEHAARILHMERARDELAGHTKTLRHQLFKTLHTKVDVMVRETCVVQRLADVRRRTAGAAS